MKLFSKGKRLLVGKKKKIDLFDDGKWEGLFDGGEKDELLHQVRRGDLGYIKTVDQNVLLNATDEDGSTVLLMATNMGNLNLCKEILIKCPSLLYHVNFYNKTVLHEATDLFFKKTVLREKFLFIDLFVSVGLNEIAASNEEGIYMKFRRWMKTKNSNGDTALLEAARLGNLQVVKRFVEVDRRYNLGLSKVVGDEGKTALNWAMENEDLEMVKLLSDEKNPYSNFVPYSTAMDLFNRVRRGDLHYIKTVEPNVLLNSRDQDRMSVLCNAAIRDQLDCCKEILKICPSLLYHQNNQKMSVLHHVAHYKIYRLIDFFVRAGLDAAKSEGDMEKMIQFKNWINLQDSSGNTALTVAVITRSNDIVKRFVQVDRQYKLGLTEIVSNDNKKALHWAMHYEDYEMIKMLTANFPVSNTMQQALESLQTGNSSGAVASKTNSFTLAEVSKHNNLKDSWLSINDKVYDVTKFLKDHPGGSEVLLKATGKDVTTDFKKANSHSSKAVTVMDKFNVGVCDSFTCLLSKLANDKPQLYSRVQLKKFTKDFSQPLGSGGFGDVYKGRFPDGVFIAVKVLKNIMYNEKFMEEQFVAEVGTMGRAHHRKLIRLYGYCYEASTNFKALVYDYVENGSFDTILFQKKLDIPWAKLHNIAKEIAQGISYLHESCSPQIIHQDIKPSNVLLDSNLSPKVIDFGLAKVNMGESQFEQTKIKGSRGYMAPEVNQITRVKQSCKLDVYSFGMMLFDILGSKRNHVDKDKCWFPGQVWEKYKTDQLDKFLLNCGIKEEDKEYTKRFAIIALLCVEHNPRARPMLSNVVNMLEGKIKLDTPVAPFYPDYYLSDSSSMCDSRDY